MNKLVPWPRHRWPPYIIAHTAAAAEHFLPRRRFIELDPVFAPRLHCTGHSAASRGGAKPYTPHLDAVYTCKLSFLDCYHP